MVPMVLSVQFFVEGERAGRVVNEAWAPHPGNVMNFARHILDCQSGKRDWFKVGEAEACFYVSASRDESTSYPAQ
jgi:hypothetical protein